MPTVTLTPVALGSGPDTSGADTLHAAFTKQNANEAALKQGFDLAVQTVDAYVKTSSITPGLSDAGAVIEMNVASANTFTIPPNASVPFPIGTVIEVCQVGAGATTIAAGSGVTLRPGNAILRQQWSSVSLRKRGTNEWVLAGDVA